MSRSQKKKILAYLKQHGEITIKEAIYELGITQAATRIKELIEDDGEPITREDWKEVTKKDGTKVNVRVYRYVGSGQQDIFKTPRHPRFGDPV